MLVRSLGRSGLEVAPLALGCNVFGWTADEATSFSLLDEFVGAGFNLLDTADAYSRWVPGHAGGESESIIGRWLAARGPAMRRRVLIATKVGSDMGEAGKGLSAGYVAAAFERSLRRLQTDYVDLYQVHRDDPATPVEETLGAFDRLVRAGRVRAIGVSNMEADRLEESLAASARLGLARYESVQPHYNLYDRAGFEATLAPLCRRAQLGVIPYYALAAGFLTGKYRTVADAPRGPRAPGALKKLDARGLAILAALDEVAAGLGATPSQVALAWLVARGVTAPIASATSVAQLRELLAFTRLSLDDEALARLDLASAPAAAGA